MASECYQSARNVRGDSERTDQAVDDVGEYIQVAVSAETILDALDDATKSCGDGVGHTVLYNSEDVVEMHHQRANERV